MVFPHIADNRLVEIITGNTDRGGHNNSSQGNHRDIRGPPADIDNHVAAGLRDIYAGPDCRGYGFLHNCHLPGSRLIGGLFHSSAFHIRHTAGHTDDNSGLSEASSSHGFLNEIPKHLLCDHIVRDHALAQRPDCHDIAGSPADHLTCFFAYGLYFI